MSCEAALAGAAERSDPKTYELAERCVREASAKGLYVGAAESCTGGLVSGALTDIAGSSAVVRGSVVSYHPDVKCEVLGVDRQVIDDQDVGVVSAECAQQMARGARRVLGADVAVSVTGIAGPGGAEPGKPVGTVWFGLSTAFGERTCLRHFDGGRAAVRRAATCAALELLLEGIMESESKLS